MSSVIENYKVQKCAFYNEKVKGCEKGRLCPNYHFNQERRRDPKKFTYAVKLCPFKWKDLHTNYCPSKDHCIFSHTKNEVLYHPKVYKSVLCEDFEKMGQSSNCLREFCDRAHGDDDLFSGFDSMEQFAEVANRFEQVEESSSDEKVVFTKERNKLDKLSEFDLSTLEFDFSAIPATEENEDGEIRKLKEEISDMANECVYLSLEYKKRFYDIVDAITEKILQEQDKNCHVRSEVKYYERLARKKRENFTAISSRVKCPICFVNDRDAVLIPCGHIFCNACVKSIPDKRCYFCKKSSGKVVEIKAFV